MQTSDDLIVPIKDLDALTNNLMPTNSKSCFNGSYLFTKTSVQVALKNLFK
jgi:hypothetical protein